MSRQPSKRRSGDLGSQRLQGGIFPEEVGGRGQESTNRAPTRVRNSPTQRGTESTSTLYQKSLSMPTLPQRGQPLALPTSLSRPPPGHHIVCRHGPSRLGHTALCCWHLSDLGYSFFLAQYAYGHETKPNLTAAHSWNRRKLLLNHCLPARRRAGG